MQARHEGQVCPIHPPLSVSRFSPGTLGTACGLFAYARSTALTRRFPVYVCNWTIRFLPLTQNKCLKGKAVALGNYIRMPWPCHDFKTRMSRMRSGMSSEYYYARTQKQKTEKPTAWREKKEIAFSLLPLPLRHNSQHLWPLLLFHTPLKKKALLFPISDSANALVNNLSAALRTYLPADWARPD